VTIPTEPPVSTWWPKFLTAGTTFKLDRSFPDYAVGDWSYSVAFAGAQVQKFSATPQITADPSGSTYHLVLAPADTLPLNPSGGDRLAYHVFEHLTASDGEVFEVGHYRLMVHPPGAAAVAGDFVSFEERMLAKLQATLEARITGGAIENYSVAGRSITKIATREIEQMIGRYKLLVWRQRNPGRFGVPGTFSFPSIDQGPFPPGNRWSR
jgi:hypothetical protein